MANTTNGECPYTQCVNSAVCTIHFCEVLHNEECSGEPYFTCNTCGQSLPDTMRVVDCGETPLNPTIFRKPICGNCYNKL